MSYTPLVSIIIPVYNAGDLLQNCLHSVLQQTYQNWEVILVNDGSTDNTIENASRLIASDSRIRLIHQDNQGAATARNLAIEHSKGEYFFFLDSDDTLSEDTISYMLQLMQETNTELAITGVAYYNQLGQIYKKATFKKGVYNFSNVLEMMYTDHKVLCLCGGKMFTRNCLGDLRFVPGQLVEDAFFIPILFKQAGKMVLSPKIQYHYNTGSTESASYEVSVKKSSDHLGVLYVIKDLFKDNAHLSSVIATRIFEIRGHYLQRSIERQNDEVFKFVQSYHWTGFSELSRLKKMKFIRLFVVISFIHLIKMPFLWKVLVKMNSVLKKVLSKFDWKNRKRQYAVFKRGYKQVKRVGYFSDNAYRYFLFSNAKVVYIDNSKVASTSIKEALLIQEGDDMLDLFKNDVHIHCQHYYMKDIDEHTSFPYFSFAFVRNPFERVVSTYKDMYQKPDRHWTTFKTYFFGYFKKDKGFDYFVRKGPLRISDKWADTHLISQHILVYCKNEQPYVDFIGRFENLSEDWKLLQGKVDLPELPIRNQTKASDWRDYYTKELAHLVYKRYQKDIETFGYEDEYTQLLHYLDEKEINV